MPINDMPMYVEVPETYTWDSKTNTWKERVNKKLFAVGKTDFTDMLTLPSGQCETYKQVCEQLGLLQDDGEWIEVLSESALTMPSKKLRNLYFIIIVWSAQANPRQ